MYRSVRFTTRHTTGPAVAEPKCVRFATRSGPGSSMTTRITTAGRASVGRGDEAGVVLVAEVPAPVRADDLRGARFAEDRVRERVRVVARVDVPPDHRVGDARHRLPRELHHPRREHAVPHARVVRLISDVSESDGMVPASSPDRAKALNARTICTGVTPTSYPIETLVCVYFDQRDAGVSRPVDSPGRPIRVRSPKPNRSRPRRVVPVVHPLGDFRHTDVRRMHEHLGPRERIPGRDVAELPTVAGPPEPLVRVYLLVGRRELVLRHERPDEGLERRARLVQVLDAPVPAHRGVDLLRRVDPADGAEAGPALVRHLALRADSPCRTSRGPPSPARGRPSRGSRPCAGRP